MRYRTTAAAWLLGCALPPSLPAEDQVIPVMPVVKACVDGQGKLVSTEIAESSSYPEIDEAALKIARATKFRAGTDKKGKPHELSCIKFRIKFVVRDGEPVQAG